MKKVEEVALFQVEKLERGGLSIAEKEKEPRMKQ